MLNIHKQSLVSPFCLWDNKSIFFSLLDCKDTKNNTNKKNIPLKYRNKKYFFLWKQLYSLTFAYKSEVRLSLGTYLDVKIYQCVCFA